MSWRTFFASCALALCASCTSSPTPAPDASNVDKAPPTDTATVDDRGVTDVPVSQDSGVTDTPIVMDVAHDHPAQDVPSMDVPGRDVPTVDVPAVDVARPDVPPTDVARVDAGRCDPAGGCFAFWCGCGRCNPAMITCTPTQQECPLDCVQSCPELDTAVCRCESGTCGAPTFTDAGVRDGGAAGDLCASNSECGSGLLCCYPCGIPGCMNRCMAPDPMTGRCPLFP